MENFFFCCGLFRFCRAGIVKSEGECVRVGGDDGQECVGEELREGTGITRCSERVKDLPVFTQVILATSFPVISKG